MPSLRFIAVSGLVAVLASPVTLLRAGEVERALDYRQGLMYVFAYNATSMGDMVKGKTAFDRAAFARHAKDLAAAAGLDLLGGFPKDSVSEDSEAKDAIWVDWEKFQQRFRALQEESTKLAQVAADGDQRAIEEQFRATSNTCKACHDDFKE